MGGNVNLKKTIIATAAGVLSVCGVATASYAASQLLPGISTGLPLGLPLPEGVWDVTQGAYGARSNIPRVDVNVTIPSWLIWSTPWTIAGGRFLLDTVAAIADVNIKNVSRCQGLGNSYIDAQLKWDLGGGFFGGFQTGVFLPVRNELTVLGASRNFASFMEIGALTYIHDGWDLTATLIYGTGKSGSMIGYYGAPAWFNYDLTALKKIGKWQFGAVGFGSTDLNSPFSGYEKQSQFALGGLIGYDFGVATLQLKLTRDLYQKHYTGYETQGGFNLIIPIWAPPPAPAV